MKSEQFDFYSPTKRDSVPVMGHSFPVSFFDESIVK